MNTTDELLTSAIKFIVIPLMIWAGAKITQLLDAWIGSIKDARFSKALSEARVELSNAVKDSVTFVYETFIKALALEGPLTKEQGETAFKLAAERVEAIMSAAGWKVLEKAEVVINDLIQTQIEAIIPVVKTEAVSADYTRRMAVASQTMVEEVKNENSENCFT
jgi:hypothetical protein